MEVSPGVVMARAPWAAPYSTAFCGVVVLQEAVDQAGGEAVAAADAVEDLELRVRAALVELRRRASRSRPSR